MRLHVCNDLTGIGLEPASVQLLGNGAKLDNEVAGEVLWLSLAAFLAPEPLQSIIVVSHNDSGVGAAKETASGF
jgi:hypothetical protein